MRRWLMAVLVAAVSFTSSQLPARAELCTIDAIPAATLLLPYFEVDLSKFPRLNKAEQTIISLQNATVAPVLAHVTLWTDLSVPTLSFDIYLTGYDIEEINLTELFYTGEIKGLPVSDVGLGFVLGTSPAGGLQTRGELIQAHRGESIGGRCYGRALQGNIARGYVTIDNVSQLSTLFPSDVGYFASGGSGVANNLNSLWGVVFVASNKAIQSDLLVHIEAGDFGAGDQTFYGRYVGYTGRDGREPLGTQWAARYFSGQDRTDVVVWRDSTAVQGPFTCAQLGQSGWYPLEHVQVAAFNEAEDAVEPFFDPDVGEMPGFPAETQKIKVASGAFDVSPFKSGWLFMNLRDPDLTYTQSYVWILQGKRKRASAYPGLPWYDHQIGGEAADASACGPAPASTHSPIP